VAMMVVAGMVVVVVVAAAAIVVVIIIIIIIFFKNWFCSLPQIPHPNGTRPRGKCCISVIFN